MKHTLDIPRTALEVFNMLPEGTRCEVIDNSLYMLPSPTSDHQDILGDIFFKIKQEVNKNQSGKVYIAPLDVYLDNEQSVVQPDIIFISTANQQRVQRKGILGSPDMVIEILSSNRDYDKEKKFELYQKSNIPEYIIIDPETKQVWHYLLKEYGSYEQSPSESGKLNISSLKAQFNF
jgi:Uma2 family endonuclease